MDQIIIQFFNGLTLAMVLILVSLGLAIIFGMMGVINLAHGEFFMLGAYTVLGATRLELSPWAGMILAPVTVGAVGMGLERGVIRYLYERPMVTLLATWGISIVFRQSIRIVLGPGHKNILNPMAGNVSLLGIVYPSYRLFIIGVTCLVILGVWLLFERTRFGLRCRAVIQKREMASALGIDVHLHDQFIFALGAGMAGLAGAIMSPIITVNPEMGLDFLARSFLVVIVGGVGQLVGVLAGGGIMGAGEGLISFFARPVISQIMVFTLAILVIRLRPKGLLGR